MIFIVGQRTNILTSADDEIEIIQFSNTDMSNIFMPIDVDELRQYLTMINYDKDETRFLLDGFQMGFP